MKKSFTEKIKKAVSDLREEVSASAAMVTPQLAPRTFASSTKSAVKRRSFEAIGEKPRDTEELAPLLASVLKGRGDKQRTQELARKAGCSEQSVKSLNESTLGEGGVFVPESISEMVIEWLYPRSIILSSGPMRQVTATGNMTFATIASKQQTQWLGEEVLGTPSNFATGQIKMDLKKIAAFMVVTNELLMDSSINLESQIQSVLLPALATDIDKALIMSPGSVHSPKGLLNLVSAGNTLVSTGATASQIESDITRMRARLVALEIPMSRPVWIMGSGSRAVLSSLRDAAGNKIYPSLSINNTLEQYPVRETSYMPNGSVMLVDMSQMIYLEGEGDRSSRMETSREAGNNFFADTTAIRLIQALDFAPTRSGNEIVVLNSASWANNGL